MRSVLYLPPVDIRSNVDSPDVYLIFAGIALKLFQVSIYVDLCHPLQQTTGNIFKAPNIVYRLYRTTL